MTTKIVNNKWEHIQTDVRKIKDTLGMPVDEEIFETVTVLRYLGINTSASCAGHLDRVTHGPYIHFLAPQVNQLRQQMQAIGDRKNPEYQKLLDEATYYNLHEQLKVLPYLDEFYTQRIVPYGQRIIVQLFKDAANMIVCQGTELAYIMEEQEQAKLLRNNQNEMQFFTKFLKNKFGLS